MAPKRSRRGAVSEPTRVVAPTTVKGGSERRIERAPGPFADHYVNREILHRGIQAFLDGPCQAVDLVDEQHLTLLQRSQDGGQVSRVLDGRPGGGTQIDAHLDGDDVTERSLAQSRRPIHQHMIDGLFAAARRLQQDAEVILDLLLPDIFSQATGPQTALDHLLFLGHFR